jgi:outer membrane protein assembly factor BamB
MPRTALAPLLALPLLSLLIPMAHAGFGPPAIAGWNFEAGGEIVSLTSGGDRLYAATDDGSLSVLRAADGRLLWSAALGAPAAGQVVVRGGRAFVGTVAGHVVCVRPPMLREGIVGMEDWRFNAAAPVACGPIATAAGTVVFADRAGTVYALTAKGQPAWTADTRSEVVASPAASERSYPVPGSRARSPLVYWGTTGGSLQAVAETGGQPVWGFDAGGAVRVPPLVAGDVLVAATEQGAVYALDAGSGQLRWHVSVGDAVTGGLAACGGQVCVTTGQGRVALLRLSDGSAVWQSQVAAPVSTAAVAAGDSYVLVASEAGMAYALRRSDGRTLWARNLKARLCTGLVLSGDCAALGTTGGRVGALVHGGPWQIDAAPEPTADAAETAPRGEAPSGEAPVVVLPMPQTPTLVTRSTDRRQPAVQLMDQPQMLITGQAPPGTTAVSVNESPARLEGRGYSAAVRVEGSGVHPLTVRFLGPAGLIAVDRRLVIVSAEAGPGSPAPVFVAPDCAGQGECATFTVSPGRVASDVSVTAVEIRDEAGRTIRKWADASGEARSFAWDGRDALGAVAADGAYKVVCSITDRAGRARVMYQPVVVDTAGE